MKEESTKTAPYRAVAGEKHRGEAKLARIPIKIEQPAERLRKPTWIRAKSPFHPNVKKLKAVLREQKLHTVCEEAACPNLGECFGKGTATFMIMGDICTRRCPFCDVGHGRPNSLDSAEPDNLADTIQAMGLNYVVITSVDRDDLHRKSAREKSTDRNRNPGTRFSRPYGDRARADAECATGCIQPQSGNRAASLQTMPPWFGLSMVAGFIKAVQTGAA
jgi:hypothetical protein